MGQYLDLRRAVGAGNNVARELVLWIVYAALLSLCYKFVVGIWGYQGFNYSFDLVRLLFGGASIIFLAFFATTLAPVIRIFSGLAIGLILVPSVILFAFGDFSWGFFGLTVFSIFVTLVVAAVTPKRVLRSPKISSLLIVRVLTLISLINLVAIVAIGGFSNVNLDLFRVYEYRESVKEVLPGFFGYINAFTVRAALPFMLVLGLQEKNRVYVLLSLGMSFAFFALTANRLPLFQPILVATVFFATGRANYSSWLALGFCAISLVGLISFLFWDGGVPPEIATLSIYRGLFVPVLVNWQYIDYFGNYSKFFYWSESKVTLGLVAPADSLPMINVIGAEYWAGPHVAANAGLIGSGYGNAGVIGVLLYSIVFGLLLALLEGYAKRHGHKLVLSLLLVPLVIGLNTADFVTLFLSQGLGASLLMLMLLRVSDQRKNLPVHQKN